MVNRGVGALGGWVVFYPGLVSVWGLLLKRPWLGGFCAINGMNVPDAGANFLFPGV